MKTLLLLSSILFFGQFLHASTESSYELTCRAKAKETAAEIYRGCINEKKSAEIERLRRDYQERLKNLKAEYEREIEGLGIQKTKKTKVSKLAPSKKATRLPKRQELAPSEPQAREPIQAQEPDESQMDLPEPIQIEINQQ